jgi:hypothetical protein
MNYGEIFWLMFVGGLLLLLIHGACTAPHYEHSDQICWRFVGILFFTVLFIISYNIITHEPVVPDPMQLVFWNRSLHNHHKAGIQIANWRKPDVHLPANEYLMGVELAKNNACHYFNFHQQADIAKFKRCTYFFPDMLTEYKVYHQANTGIVI